MEIASDEKVEGEGGGSGVRNHEVMRVGKFPTLAMKTFDLL